MKKSHHPLKLNSYFPRHKHTCDEIYVKELTMAASHIWKRSLMIGRNSFNKVFTMVNLSPVTIPYWNHLESSKNIHKIVNFWLSQGSPLYNHKECNAVMSFFRIISTCMNLKYNLLAQVYIDCCSNLISSVEKLYLGKYYKLLFWQNWR